MIVPLGSDTVRAMRPIDLEVHFRRTFLPLQTMSTYERLAAHYNIESAKGLTEKALADGMMSRPDLFISGDKRTVAYGVLATARTIKQGTAIADVSTSPSWKEAYDMGIGRVTGPWDDIPWMKMALIAGGAVLAYGFVSGLGRGVASR